jgi:transposase
MIRMDHTASALLALAANSDDADQIGGLLAIAIAVEGTSRLDASCQADVDRQTLIKWVHRYNEDGIDGLVSRKPPGATPQLTKAETAELGELVLAGADPATHQVIRWRCLDPREEIARRFSVIAPERAIGK